MQVLAIVLATLALFAALAASAIALGVMVHTAMVGVGSIRLWALGGCACIAFVFTALAGSACFDLSRTAWLIVWSGK